MIAAGDVTYPGDGSRVSLLDFLRSGMLLLGVRTGPLKQQLLELTVDQAVFHGNTWRRECRLTANHSIVSIIRTVSDLGFGRSLLNVRELPAKT